jgi:hypothetical protein
VPPPHSDPLTRRVRHLLYKKRPLDHGFSPYTTALATAAIQKSSSLMATGPDRLCSLHLKHHGPDGIAYLTDVFNLSVKDNVIPAVWKAALVVPVRKPGKPADQGASYRPIYLISPVVKILEKAYAPCPYKCFPTIFFSPWLQTGPLYNHCSTNNC